MTTVSKKGKHEYHEWKNFTNESNNSGLPLSTGAKNAP